MKRILLTLFPILSISVFAQNYICGKISDLITGKAIQYANVGIMNKGIGTVSDESGNFLIDSISNISVEDTLIISTIGY